MTLYYSLVFLLLMFEMVVFMALIIPMPFTWRKKLFTFISESPFIAKLQYGMKITFIFILILFIDSVNRVYRVQLEKAHAQKDGAAESLGGTARMEIQARKFYSERNMYLCGFTLFLSLILNRTYVMILDQLRLEEEVKRIHGDSKVKGRESQKLANTSDPGEIVRLRSELDQKNRDLETMKKQHESFQREYNRLADEKSAVDGTPKKDR